MENQINQTIPVVSGEKKSNWLVWVLIIVGVIAIIAIGFVIYLLVSDNEVEDVESQMSDVERGTSVMGDESSVSVPEENVSETILEEEMIVPEETASEEPVGEEIVSIEIPEEIIEDEDFDDPTGLL